MYLKREQLEELSWMNWDATTDKAALAKLEHVLTKDGLPAWLADAHHQTSNASSRSTDPSCAQYARAHPRGVSGSRYRRPL